VCVCANRNTIFTMERNIVERILDKHISMAYELVATRRWE
jgi:hypothetical protein